MSPTRLPSLRDRAAAALLALVAAVAPAPLTAQPVDTICRAADRPVTAYDPAPSVGTGYVVQAAADVGAQGSVGTVAGGVLRCQGRVIRWGTGTDSTAPWRAYALVPDSGFYVAAGDYQTRTAAARAVIRARTADLRAVRLAALLVPATLQVPAADPADSGRVTAVHYTGISRTPELPRMLVDTRPPAIVGRVLAVACGPMGNVQNAVDSAQAGDVVRLPADCVFPGTLHSRRRAHTGVVTVLTAGADTLAAGVRPDSLTASHYATLRLRPDCPSYVVNCTQSYNPSFIADSATYGFRLAYVRFDAQPVLTKAARMASVVKDTYRRLQDFPNRVLFDHLWIAGHDSLSMPRCVHFDVATGAIVDSYIARCHGASDEAQAVLVQAAPGPLAIVNTYLEGAGENVMFGGASGSQKWGNPYWGLARAQTADVVLERDHFYKPLTWRTPRRWTVKNLLELKYVERILIVGPVLENSWKGDQEGNGLVIKTSVIKNNLACCYVGDVTVRFGRLYGVRSMLPISALQTDSTVLTKDPKADSLRAVAQPTQRVLIAHLLADSATYDGVALKRASPGALTMPDLALVNNTFTCAPTACTHATLFFDFPVPVATRFTMDRNVFDGRGPFAIGSKTNASEALAVFGAGYRMTGNAFVGVPASLFSAADAAASLFPTSLAAALALPNVGADRARVLAATWGVQPSTFAR